jgi:hypothetical protein
MSPSLRLDFFIRKLVLWAGNDDLVHAKFFSVFKQILHIRV